MSNRRALHRRNNALQTHSRQQQLTAPEQMTCSQRKKQRRLM